MNGGFNRKFLVNGPFSIAMLNYQRVGDFAKVNSGGHQSTYPLLFSQDEGSNRPVRAGGYKKTTQKLVAIIYYIYIYIIMIHGMMWTSKKTFSPEVFGSFW